MCDSIKACLDGDGGCEYVKMCIYGDPTGPATYCEGAMDCFLNPDNCEDIITMLQQCPEWHDAICNEISLGCAGCDPCGGAPLMALSTDTDSRIVALEKIVAEQQEMIDRLTALVGQITGQAV